MRSAVDPHRLVTRGSSAALIVLSLACDAYADPGFATTTIDLDRRASPACPAVTELASAVDARLARHVVVDHGADLALEVLFVPSDGGWTANVTLRTAAGVEIGTRALHVGAPDCSALGEALPLVLALMVDVPRDELPAVPPAPALETPRPRTRLRVPPPRRGLAPEIGVAGLAAAGALPGLALGARVRFGVAAVGDFSFGVHASLWRPSEGDAAGDARFTLASAGAFVCPIERAALGGLFHGCVSQQVGRLGATGVGWEHDQHDTRLWLQLGANAGFDWTLVAPLALRVDVGAGVPLTRDRYFGVDASGARVEVFHGWVAVPEVELGMVGRFR